MSDDVSSTRRIDVYGFSSAGTALRPTETGDAWSFGIRSRVLLPSAGAVIGTRTPPRPSANAADSDTDGPPATPDFAALRPVTVSNLYFGKRAFAPTYHWEGVVEQVAAAGFRGRLTPIEHGSPREAQVEYADFDYEELADPAERALVSIGAVFYWTIGKSRNAAGTLTNQSLVRFRRLPPVSAQMRARASAEAEALLRDLN